MSRRTSEHTSLLGGDEEESSSNKRCSSVKKAVVCIVVILVVAAVITLLSLQLAVTWNKLGNIEIELNQHRSTSHQPTTTTTRSTVTTTTRPTTTTTAISPWSHPQIKDCFYTTTYSIDEFSKADIKVARVRNGSLLLGTNNQFSFLFSTLLVYDTFHFKTLSKIPLSWPLFDAIWTPEGNILYTLTDIRKVVLIMPNGTVIRETRMSAPRHLTLAENGRDIFLADRDDGAFKSSDGGLTWVHVYQPNDDWECWKFFAVSNDSNVYWSYEILSGYSGANIYRLVVSVDGGVSWREVNIPSDVSMELSINENTIMTYDWNGNFLLAGDGDSSRVKPMYIFSYEGHYVGKQIRLSDPDLPVTLRSLDVNPHTVNGTSELYIGDRGRVGKYLLTYYSA